MRIQERVFVILKRRMVNAMSELYPMSFKVEKALYVKIDELAKKEFAGKKTPLIKAALLEFLVKKDHEYKKIPNDVKVRIDYIFNLLVNGPVSLNSWEIIKDEVKELWENVKEK